MHPQRLFPLAAAVAALLLASVPPASAGPAGIDFTAFLGAAGGPSTRLAAGLAVGSATGPLGWEVEYGHVGEDATGGSPTLQTLMVNGLGQTTFDVHGMQFYGTLGAGFYHESLLERSQTNIAVNGGGGVKMKMGGPFRLRLDYRLTRLVGSAIGSHWVHRFYVGANVGF
jgi:hypothetical protein